jgi:hypothetical protein
LLNALIRIANETGLQKAQKKSVFEGFQTKKKKPEAFPQNNASSQQHKPRDLVALASTKPGTLPTTLTMPAQAAAVGSPVEGKSKMAGPGTHSLLGIAL